MLEKPDLPEEAILLHLQAAFGLHASSVEFLPIGADANTAVYRVRAAGEREYFLKFRKGDFDKAAVAIPSYLHSLGIHTVIAPLETCRGDLWASLGAFKSMLYPFVHGVDGYAQGLSAAQWVQLGAAFQCIHSVPLPPRLKCLLPVETWDSSGRQAVKFFQQAVESAEYSDRVAAEFAALMKSQRSVILHLVERAGQLSKALQNQPLELVLCHADMHPGNVLITQDGPFYIVDWDNPILAPKEHDLMAFGGDGSGAWHSLREEALFYRGYGPAVLNRSALAYYRYERIIQDVAAFCRQILATTEGGEDRQQGLRYFASNFLPGHEIEIAFRTDENGSGIV